MAVYNVINFGATGNGSTDDTAAIVSAIAACGGGSSAGVVYFPAGTYRITSTLSVANKTGCVLKGDGNGATYILNSNRASNAITFSTCAYCGVEDLFIHSDRSAGNPTAGYAIAVTNGSFDNHVRNVNIGYCYNGILVSSSTETIVAQVLIRGPYGQFGINYVGTSAQRCYGMTVEDVVVDPIDTGNVNAMLLVMDSYAFSLTIKRTALIQGGFGFVMRDSAGVGQDSRPKFVEAFDLECDHNDAVGVWLQGGEAFYLSEGWIGSCLRGNGLLVDTGFAGDMGVTTTRIYGNAQFGVLIQNGPTDINISTSVISVNGTQAANSFDGVAIVNSGTIVTGCRIGGAAGAIGQQRYGVVITGFAQNTIVTSNNTLGNISGGISNSGIAPFVVANNL